MDIRLQASWLARKIGRVLWFVVRNPFLILKKTIRWGLVALFWLFVLGWGISAFAAEWSPAKATFDPKPTGIGNCGSYAGPPYISQNITYSGCIQRLKYNSSSGSYDFSVEELGYAGKNANGWYFAFKYGKPSGPKYEAYFTTGDVISKYACPPDGKPDFTVGPKTLNGQQVCEKKPVSCKIGEQLFMDSTTGAETCKPNCASVAGQVHENMAYNQAFLPSATVLCYGLCSVTSSGVTVGNANTFEQFGTIQFTGAECPVKFPAEGEGQTIQPNNPPTSSDATNNAQGNLQDAANNATNNPTSGATGTATLNDVVNKVAETSNKEIKAMSEQNAAMGKVIENVGKDIQGAIKDSAHGSGAGASAAQLQTTNAIKDTNKTLQEISDKLDEQKEDPKPPVKPGTSIEPSAKDIHKANDWGTRNFGTVLEANANRFKALPIFSAPSSFFTANFGGSTCPTYSGSFSLFGATTAFQLEAFCSTAVLNMMPYIRAVVMMVFGFFAWRIAVGNGG
ncbi:hypothetical protein JHD42_22665 [Aeromonas veronii]|uniref:hypothetical protein n=1 Tax=Aeromonas veronii TaxID=654 RepID=UPI0018F18A51|nr:hypothetical protein [Aeromonas veronii]MBJ7583831.1 hypothetical protein [Aeromonas veronii]